MLPVELAPRRPRLGRVARRPSRPIPPAPVHPIWHISADDAQNRALLEDPAARSSGHNRVGRGQAGGRGAGPDRLGAPAAAGGRRPALRPGPDDGHGHRRSPAAGRASSPSRGARADARYYKKFWRNVGVLADRELLDRPPPPPGRDRQAALPARRADRPPRPGLRRERRADARLPRGRLGRAEVGRPTSRPTTRRSAAPRPPSPTRRAAPLLPWGEEFDLARAAGREVLRRGPADRRRRSRSPPASRSRRGSRIELTAYENNTQVDSTALDVQVLDDPSEQQNPLPDHDLLRRIADAPAARSCDGPTDLSAMLDGLPGSSARPRSRRCPAWSRWWLLLAPDRAC